MTITTGLINHTWGTRVWFVRGRQRYLFSLGLWFVWIEVERKVSISP